jgi:putative transposase
MARIARVVIPGYPHHIIQRGNRRQQVFFSEGDRALYLKLLKREADRHGLCVLAYCLMRNHVHLVAVPAREDSFAKALAEAHRKYTCVINIRENWKGYLWQGRFISYPLDETHCYAAIRYIERNPVRAGIVTRAEEYPWSSARAHIMKVPDPLLSDDAIQIGISNWSNFLGQKDNDEDIQRFIDHEQTGRPLGSEDFVKRLEQLTGRILTPMRRGRKKSKKSIVSPN